MNTNTLYKFACAGLYWIMVLTSSSARLALMAHDFAKHRQATAVNRRGSQRAATRTATEGNKQAHWNWFISGILCGFLVVGIGYLGVIKLDTAITEASQPASQVTDTPNRPTFDFGFYEELTNAQIDVNDAATETSTNTTSGAVQATTTSSNQTSAVPVQDLTKYLLQAGSFQDRQDAENRRAKIILLNMNAGIVPGVVSGRTWHRVQVGPFEGRNSTDAARDLLSENNIDSIPLLLRE